MITFSLQIFSLVVYLAITFASGQIRFPEQGRWTKLSSSREGKTLRNTFPFSETANHGHDQHHGHHHDHHHHEHHHELTNSRHLSAGISLPSSSFSLPHIGIM